MLQHPYLTTPAIIGADACIIGNIVIIVVNNRIGVVESMLREPLVVIVVVCVSIVVVELTILIILVVRIEVVEGVAGQVAFGLAAANGDPVEGGAELLRAVRVNDRVNHRIEITEPGNGVRHPLGDAALGQHRLQHVHDEEGRPRDDEPADHNGQRLGRLVLVDHAYLLLVVTAVSCIRRALFEGGTYHGTPPIVDVYEAAVCRRRRRV